MSIDSKLIDALGTQRGVKVTEQNALLVSVLPQSSKGIPPSDIANLRQLREYFVEPGGSESQAVDGSTTPVEFSVSASVNVTKWINGMRLIVESTQLDLASTEFRRYGSAGGASGLTNGMEIEAVQGGVTTALTTEPVVNMGRWLNWAETQFQNFVGVAPGGADYAQFNFLFSQPVVLTEGTTDRLLFRVNDDLTGLTAQYAIARGYQEFV